MDQFSFQIFMLKQNISLLLKILLLLCMLMEASQILYVWRDEFRFRLNFWLLMNYTQFLYLDGRNLLYRFKLYRHVLLDKKNNTFNSKLIRDTAQAVKNTNTSIALAPEGQRRRKESIGDGQLQEKFKTGGFQMSLDSNSPITPVVLFGAYELLPPDKIFPNPGTVTIRFLPQIEPQKGDTVETLQQKVREAMIYSLKNPPPRTRVHQQKSSPLLFFLMLGLWGFILHSIAANFFLW